MDLDAARDFVRSNHRAVMTTRRANGDPQLSPVVCGVDAQGRVAVSTRETAFKVRNLRRDPRMALSIAPVDNPFEPVVIRGRVVEWIEGDEAWEIVDNLAIKYAGAPYPRGEERVVAVIEPEHQAVGIG